MTDANGKTNMNAIVLRKAMRWTRLTHGVVGPNGIGKTTSANSGAATIERLESGQKL